MSSNPHPYQFNSSSGPPDQQNGNFQPNQTNLPNQATGPGATGSVGVPTPYLAFSAPANYIPQSSMNQQNVYHPGHLSPAMPYSVPPMGIPPYGYPGVANSGMGYGLYHHPQLPMNPLASPHMAMYGPPSIHSTDGWTQEGYPIYNNAHSSYGLHPPTQRLPTPLPSGHRGLVDPPAVPTMDYTKHFSSSNEKHIPQPSSNGPTTPVERSHTMALSTGVAAPVAPTVPQEATTIFDNVPPPPNRLLAATAHTFFMHPGAAPPSNLKATDGTAGRATSDSMDINSPPLEEKVLHVEVDALAEQRVPVADTEHEPIGRNASQPNHAFSLPRTGIDATSEPLGGAKTTCEPIPNSINVIPPSPLPPSVQPMPAAPQKTPSYNPEAQGWKEGMIAHRKSESSNHPFISLYYHKEDKKILVPYSGKIPESDEELRSWLIRPTTSLVPCRADGKLKRLPPLLDCIVLKRFLESNDILALPQAALPPATPSTSPNLPVSTQPSGNPTPNQHVGLLNPAPTSVKIPPSRSIQTTPEVPKPSTSAIPPKPDGLPGLLAHDPAISVPTVAQSNTVPQNPKAKSSGPRADKGKGAQYSRLATPASAVSTVPQTSSSARTPAEPPRSDSNTLSGNSTESDSPDESHSPSKSARGKAGRPTTEYSKFVDDIAERLFSDALAGSKRFPGTTAANVLKAVQKRVGSVSGTPLSSANAYRIFQQAEKIRREKAGGQEYAKELVRKRYDEKIEELQKQAGIESEERAKEILIQREQLFIESHKLESETIVPTPGRRTREFDNLRSQLERMVKDSELNGFQVMAIAAGDLPQDEPSAAAVVTTDSMKNFFPNALKIDNATVVSKFSHLAKHGLFLITQEMDTQRQTGQKFQNSQRSAPEDAPNVRLQPIPIHTDYNRL